MLEGAKVRAALGIYLQGCGIVVLRSFASPCCMQLRASLPLSRGTALTRLLYGVAHVQVGSGSIVAAGAVVQPGTNIPSGQVWAGNPAKMLREVEADEKEFITKSASNYKQLADVHRCGWRGCGVCSPVKTCWSSREWDSRCLSGVSGKVLMGLAEGADAFVSGSPRHRHGLTPA